MIELDKILNNFMAQRLKSWESPRNEGRNNKGKGGSARQRQLKKRTQMLRQKLKDQSNDNQNSQGQNKKGENHDSLPFYFVSITPCTKRYLLDKIDRYKLTILVQTVFSRHLISAYLPYRER
nr:hypothetical protein [Chamaesiphon sp. VAR_48_metabat_135_sub]